MCKQLRITFITLGQSLGFVVVVLLCIGAGQTHAQSSFTVGNWQYIVLPERSLAPLALVFGDRLHGYFQAYDVVFDPLQVDTLKYAMRLFSYRTDDGGKSWLHMRIRNTSWPDTLGYSFDPSLFFPTFSLFDQRFLVAGPLVAYVYNYPSDVSASVSSTQGFYRTIDGGITWESIHHVPTVSHICLASDTTFIVGQTHSGSGGVQNRLRVSYNSGRTFTGLLGDATFDSVVFPFPYYTDPDSPQYQPASLLIAASDARHWVAVPYYTGLNNDSEYYPSGLNLLTTSDGGTSWVHRNVGYDSIIRRLNPGYGQFGYAWACRPQFVEGTPDVYLFPNNFWLADEGVGYNPLMPPKPGRQWGSDGDADITFLHSSDYGVSWKVCTDFANRRRGYEPSPDHTIYLTISRNAPITSSDKADLLASSTDDGATWAIDSQTLDISDIGHLDGRIITANGSDHLWIVAQWADRTVILRNTGVIKNRVSAQSITSTTPYLLKLYPNPGSTNVHCEILSSQRIQTIDIYDMLGRKISTPVKLETTNTASIDARLLQAGMYFIRVTWFDHGIGSYAGLLAIVK